MTDKQFLACAIEVANVDGRFKPAEIFAHFSLCGTDYENALASRLADSGLLYAPYGDTWQLTGQARELAETWHNSRATTEAATKEAKPIGRKPLERKQIARKTI
jgi:hypothetical protein